MKPSDIRPRLFILTNNHFDPTWRRCWKRRFTFRDEVFVSYADLESWYMLDNLALARDYPTYKFEAESAIVVRTFLERHPEHLEELRNLVAEGRFAVTGAGEAIVDSNMVLGESLVRNFVLGQLWVDETLNHTPQLGVRNDAFGNSAQLPQILRGCELVWATGMSYTPAQGIYWRGLDGSTVVHRALPVAASGGGNTKYPPCPICQGTGTLNQEPCHACSGRGIDSVEVAWLPGPVDQDVLGWLGAGLVLMTPEELLPNPEIVTWAETHNEHYDVSFARGQDLLPNVQPWIDHVGSPDEDAVHPSVELNPNNSGCWVTRIQTKQTCRRQEYELLSTEVLATMAALRHRTAYPKQALNDIWRLLFFTQFHDALTATHVDPAYAEIQDIWQQIDEATHSLKETSLLHLMHPDPTSISVLNLRDHTTSEICTVTVDAVPEPLAIVDDLKRPQTIMDHHRQDDGTWLIRFLATGVAGLGAERYHMVTGVGTQPCIYGPIEGPVSIENRRFRIEADERGLVAIFDKTLGKDIAAEADYRPAELILEHDEGSPWATLHPDQTRTRLAPYTCFGRVERTHTFERLIYEVFTPRGFGFSGSALSARVEVTLVAGLDRVDLHIDTHWDAFNHRVRVAVPVPFRGKHTYEIPYGILVREPYEPTFGWAGANGDWPAVNWAGVEGTASSVALLNKGTPSYRMEHTDDGETIFVSLLRSPAVPTYLHEPEFYTMTEWDGMRDAGDHAFDLALNAYDVPFAESSVVADADGYNAGLLGVQGRVRLPAVPSLKSEVARISALKRAEQAKGLILRIQEFRGQGGKATLVLPDTFTSATKVNMLERRPEALPVENHNVRLNLRPWEIATLHLTQVERKP